jgi:protocatechuate 3,4-dioxygenase beta subunit
MIIKPDPGQRVDAHAHAAPAADLLSRRVILRRMGAALVAAPLLPLLSCSTDSGRDADAAADGSGSDAATDSAAGDISSVAWATGGTAAMHDKASYPNPFATGSTSACALTCAMVVGPCYSAQSETIQDISYGYDGLPTRMYLQILDESCKPVPGAVVDVWHVSAAGKYSGDDSVNENVAFCTGNDSDFTSHLYFRGKQATDSQGVVFFDTCFPGWYAGRTIHIHMTVSVGDQAFVTTQLFFADTLTDEIIGGQPLYDTRGARDTTNQNDSVIASSAVGDYLFETAKMTDGAMLAWKTLILRTSLSEALCDAPGGSMGGAGPGGDGGPPGGGPMGGDGGGPPPRG